jgi:hypothetical protein
LVVVEEYRIAALGESIRVLVRAHGSVDSQTNVFGSTVVSEDE